MNKIILKDLANESVNLSQYLFNSIKNDNSLEEKTFEFVPGKYVFSREECLTKAFSKGEKKSEPKSEGKCHAFKNIAIYLKDLNNVTIDGMGSEIVAKGRAIYVMIENCHNLTLKNLSFDYARPTVSEFEVVCTNGNTIDIRFHKDSWYKIYNGKLLIYSYDSLTSDEKSTFHTYSHSPKDNCTFLIKSQLMQENYNFFADVIDSKQLSDDIVRLSFLKAPKVCAGNIYELVDMNMDRCGFIVNSSSHITFSHISVHYMHGYGVLCNLSSNLNFNACNFTPRNNRHAMAYSDIIDCVNCGGDINVYDCEFNGGLKSVLRAGGIFERLTSVIGSNQISVKFVQHNCYYLDYYSIGDTISFVDKNSLCPLEENQIVDIQAIAPGETLLTLKYDISCKIKRNIYKCVVDNLSKNTASINFYDNKCYNIAGNAIELATLGKNTVKSNLFFKTQGSAVDVSCDAVKQMRSSRTKNLVIAKNEFVACNEPVINISPKILKNKAYVNYNIVVENNNFNLVKKTALVAKSTKGLIFSDNFISRYSSKNVITKNCASITYNNTKYGDD